MSSPQSHYPKFDTQPIGKNWRQGQDEQINSSHDPFTGEVLAEIKQANHADVDEAYATAKKAQKEWAKTTPQERSAVLQKVSTILDVRRDEIVSWLVREAGSSFVKAQVEVDITKSQVDAAISYPFRAHGYTLPAAIPNQESRVYRAPLGVIGVISPWNFPLNLSMRSVAPALALGNAVVLKPASDTPISGGLLIARIFEEAGLPAGLLSVVIGSGKTIGDYFVEHHVPSFISFTGSTAVGKNVGVKAMGGRYLKPVALELGGNSPLVVLDDADIDQAVRATVMGRFLHQGQICMSTNRVIVDAKVHDEFVEKLLKHVKQLKVGNPAEADTVIGPIINKTQLGKIIGMIDKAKEEGATLLLGGAPKGQIIPPHIFTDVTPDMQIANEEIFGPVLPVIKAQDEAHALEIANGTEYGLSSAVFTKDLVRGVAFAQGIRVGMTHINDITVDDQPNAPFGGEKNSGIGRFNGEWIIDEFTRTQWVTLQHKPRPYPF